MSYLYGGHNGNFLVVDSCGRTANVQVTDPATTATYIGEGELVIADDKGVALTTSTALKTVPAINVYIRNKDGEVGPKIRIPGKDIVAYRGRKYKAPVLFTAYAEVVNYNKTNHTYTLHIWEEGNFNVNHVPVSITTGDTAYTKPQLINAFVAAINLQFKTGNRDLSIPYIEASNVGNTHIKLVGLDDTNYDALTKPRSINRFSVQAIDGFATITNNHLAALTVPESVDKCTVGFGDWRDIESLEIHGKARDSFKYKELRSTGFPVKHEYNVVAGETYDTVTIEWKSKMENNGVIFNQANQSLAIALPVTNNNASQVGAATTGIIAVLEKYIVTEHGIGTAFTIS